MTSAQGLQYSTAGKATIEYFFLLLLPTPMTSLVHLPYGKVLNVFKLKFILSFFLFLFLSFSLSLSLSLFISFYLTNQLGTNRDWLKSAFSKSTDWHRLISRFSAVRIFFLIMSELLCVSLFLKISVLCTTFLNRPSPASFSFIFVFSIKHFDFYTKYAKKCPSSRQCWDSNPLPTDDKSHPITTRPGLPYFPFIERTFLLPFLLWICQY